MTQPTPPRSSFDPFALGIFVLFLLGLNYVIAHRATAISVGLRVLYIGWLIVGSVWVCWKRWKRGRPENPDRRLHK
jgi:hypothetical protein